MSIEDKLSNYTTVKDIKGYLVEKYETVIRLLLSDITLEHVRKYLK